MKTVEEDIVKNAYLAASGEESWQYFLATFQDIQSNKFSLIFHDRSYTELNQTFFQNIEDSRAREFHNHYQYINPWQATVPKLPYLKKGAWVHNFVPVETLNKTEFYEDWLKPQGNIQTGYGLSLYCNDHSSVSLLTNNALKHMNEAEEVAELLRKNLKHLRNAVELSKRLEQKSVNERNYELILEKLTSGVILTDKSFKILFANKLAENKLREGDILTADLANKIRFSSSTQDHEGENFLRTLKEENAASSIFINGSDGNKWLIYVSPILLENTDLPLVSDTGYYAWFMVPSSFKPKTDHEAIASILKLTKAEAGLALSFLQEKTAYEHADQKGITKNTVRKQVRSLLQKTDCRSQKELVTLLSRLFHHINL